MPGCIRKPAKKTCSIAHPGQYRKLCVVNHLLNDGWHGGKQQTRQSPPRSPRQVSSRRLRHVRTAAFSRNPGESAAALLVVLGTNIVEVRSIETSVTPGFKAWRLAKVSPSSNIEHSCTDCNVACIIVGVCLTISHKPINSSGHDSAHQFRMPYVRHHYEIRKNELLRPRWLLVWRLRKRWERKRWSHVVRGHSSLQSAAVPDGGAATATRSSTDHAWLENNITRDTNCCFAQRLRC